MVLESIRKYGILTCTCKSQGVFPLCAVFLQKTKVLYALAQSMHGDNKKLQNFTNQKFSCAFSDFSHPCVARRVRVSESRVTHTCWVLTRSFRQDTTESTYPFLCDYRLQLLCTWIIWFPDTVYVTSSLVYFTLEMTFSTVGRSSNVVCGLEPFDCLASF